MNTEYNRGQSMEDFKEFTYSESPPTKDGRYLSRSDEFDEPKLVVVSEGRALKNGEHFIIIGFEWKAV